MERGEKSLPLVKSDFWSSKMRTRLPKGFEDGNTKPLRRGRVLNLGVLPKKEPISGKRREKVGGGEGLSRAAKPFSLVTN